MLIKTEMSLLIRIDLTELANKSAKIAVIGLHLRFFQHEVILKYASQKSLKRVSISLLANFSLKII